MSTAQHSNSMAMPPAIASVFTILTKPNEHSGTVAESQTRITASSSSESKAYLGIAPTAKARFRTNRQNRIVSRGLFQRTNRSRLSNEARFAVPHSGQTSAPGTPARSYSHFMQCAGLGFTCFNTQRNVGSFIPAALRHCAAIAGSRTSCTLSGCEYERTVPRVSLADSLHPRLDSLSPSD